MAYVMDAGAVQAPQSDPSLPVRPESAAHQLGELNFLKYIAAYWQLLGEFLSQDTSLCA